MPDKDSGEGLEGAAVGRMGVSGEPADVCVSDRGAPAVVTGPAGAAERPRPQGLQASLGLRLLLARWGTAQGRSCSLGLVSGDLWPGVLVCAFIQIFFF